MDETVIVADAALQGERLDKAVALRCGEISRSGVQKLIDEGLVTVNGAPAGKSARVSAGDVIAFTVPEAEPLEAVPQDIPLEIVYEDASLLVVNKPQGMVVHPAPGNPDGTLVNALLYHCSGRLSSINGVVRPGIVHRIDKDTSGLLLVAKTDAAHASLAAQIQAHSLKRAYRGVVTGHLRETQGTVSLPIGRSRSDRKKQAVNGENPRDAVTHYAVEEQLRGYDLCRFRLETGRTHQIRVHMAALGHPVAGDPVYGRPLAGLRGQCLHAETVGFLHPETGAYLEFTAPLPPYFTSFLNRIKEET